VAARPDGLLLHENVLWGVFPLHLGMRQYWRDFDSLETWARTLPHKGWWRDFLRDSGGTASGTRPTSDAAASRQVYDDLAGRAAGPGLARFAPLMPAEGRMFSRGIASSEAVEDPGGASGSQTAASD